MIRVFAKNKPIALCALSLRGALPYPPISMLVSPRGPGLQEPFFFRTASALVKHKPINIEIGGAGVDNAR